MVEEAAAGRVLTVQRPWSWIRLPSTFAALHPDLHGEDPRRTPHVARDPMSVAGVDWSRVFRAVLFATWEPSADHQFRTEPVTVRVPLPLTGTEWAWAQSWVGNCPVSFDAGNQALSDGRLRCWLTRHTHPERGFVPVAVQDLSCVDCATGGASGDGDVRAVLRRLVLWVERDPKVAVLNPGWARRLAGAYLRHSGSEAVTPWWFERLTQWDDRLETLVELHRAGRAGQDLLAAQLTRCWRDKQDRVSVDAHVVIDMFRQVGYRVDDQPAQRPERPLTLFRGATEARAYGLSWTVDPQIAAHFARHRQGPVGAGRVWRTTVEPDQVLAYLSDEAEYIVDVRDHQAPVQRVDTPIP